MKRPEFKTGNASFREALNLVLDYAQQHGLHPGGRPGWIETKDGWFPPFISPSASIAAAPWDLEIVDSVAGEVKIKAGTIIADMADLTVGVTITNASTPITVSDGDKIWIEITNVNPITTATFESGSDWGDDGAYVTTGSGSGIAMTSYHYLLWEFAATGESVDGWIPINADLKARRLAQVSDFAIVHTAYQKTTSTYPLLVPVLVPYHRLVS